MIIIVKYVGVEDLIKMVEREFLQVGERMTIDRVCSHGERIAKENIPFTK